ncbi:MAG: phosphonate ABC transporter substrate-binding protein [Deltaproteobacteria bacterium]|jgi:phosphonate transport system substrate-binding protein|nr:phosphonate ABC transporter substrate-binding protein [Deltaproteobacteria bacterium]
MLQRLRLFLFGALCLAAVQGPAFAATSEINFGIINTEASQNLKSLWEPFLQDMEKRVGVRIKAFFASDYAGVVAGMQYNKVQLAWYGNKAAMEAVDRANGEVFVQTIDAYGLGGYYSHLIARVDSPLSSEKDVLAKAGELTFANGDPNSTSGFLVPGYYVFAMNHADPRKIFKRTVSANHETNALSVANGQVDVATCNSEALERLEHTQPDKRALIKTIWTSPLIPSDPIVWRRDLPEETKKKLLDFFLNYGVSGPEAAREREVLKALQWSRFQISNNDQLLPIRQLELFRERSRIEGDSGMNSAEKDLKLREVDEKLAALNARMAEIAKAK